MDYLATHETHTYRYSDQEPATSRLIPDGVDENGQAKQKWVTATFVEKYEMAAAEATEVWVTLRIPISRRDITAITNAELGEGSPMDSKRKQFLHLAEGWSFGPGQPRADVFDELRLPVWDWLDACVMDAIGRGVRSYEKKGDSSPKPSSSRGTRARSA
jgi:hypothetical protein